MGWVELGWVKRPGSLLSSWLMQYQMGTRVCTCVYMCMCLDMCTCLGLCMQCASSVSMSM